MRQKHSGTYIVMQAAGNECVIAPLGRKGKTGRARLKVHTSIAVKTGEQVQIGLATRRQKVVGFLCLAVPLAGAVLGCLFAPSLAAVCGLVLSALQVEWFKALCALAACVVLSVAMSIIADRTGSAKDTLQVVKVIDTIK